MQCSAGSPAGPVRSNNTPCNHRAVTEPTNRARSAASSGSTRGFSVIYKSNHLFVIQLEGHHRRQSARISKVVSRRCFQNTHSYSRRPCASPTSDKQEAQCPGTIRPLKRVLSPSTSNRQISSWVGDGGGGESFWGSQDAMEGRMPPPPAGSMGHNQPKVLSGIFWYTATKSDKKG